MRLFVNGDEMVLVSRTEPCFDQLPLVDPYVSRKALKIERKGGRVELDSEAGLQVSVEGRRLTDRIGLGREELARGAVIELGGRVVLVLEQSPVIELSEDPLGLVGGTAAIEQVRRQIRSVADLSGAVLIRGATGTGKELAARAIHDAGPRRDGPFVAVNMSAIPGSVAASELFGHTKGAFSGADADHPGYFGRAIGGTIFLDEIGELTPEIQPMLLRFLESSEVQPVGAASTERVDVRVVTATDADLERMVAEGRFREPLWFRLSSLQIELPQLRQRRADIGRLLAHFLQRALEETKELERLEGQQEASALWFPSSLAARFILAPWPGNVRQLANLVRHVVVRNRGLAQVTVDEVVDRALESDDPSLPQEQGAEGDGDLRDQVREYEVRLIEAALEACDYSKPRAAEKLNLPYRTLAHKIKTLGIRDKPE